MCRNLGAALIASLLLALAACRTAPLSSDSLYNRATPADAGGDKVDTAPPPPDAEPTPDQAGPPDGAAAPDADPLCPEGPPLQAPPACEPNRREAGFSGGVVDACEPQRTINANVSIGGQRRCSGAGKGAFDFQLLQVGCKLTLVAARPGYQRFCRVLTAPRAGYTIKLERLGGCTAPFPGPHACTCDEPGCQPYTGD